MTAQTNPQILSGWAPGAQWAPPSTVQVLNPDGTELSSNNEPGFWYIPAQTGQSTKAALEPGIAVITDVAGMIPATKVIGAVGSIANDRSPMNIAVNIVTTVSAPIISVPVGIVNLINDGINFIVNGVMAPMFNAAPPQMIDDGNGHLIPNPALMDEYD